MAQLVDAPILLVRISTAVAARHIKNAQTKLLPIHVETCPQYLYLMSDSLRGEDLEGSKYVCSPPLRNSKADLDALWEGIANGTFTTFSSGHAPFPFHHPQGKQLGIKDGVARFTNIPNGLPGVETRLPLLYKGMQEGRITIQKFVEVACANPAKLYGLDEKGSIAPGYDADIVIWYKDADFAPLKLTNEMLHQNIDYAPYENVEFGNWPRYTLIGSVVWARDEGGIVGEKTYGKFVQE
jgi:dihydropyrimidinase